MIAFDRDSKYLTQVSIEALSIFTNDEKNQSFKTLKKEIDKAKIEINKADLNIKEKVNEVAELVVSDNLINNYNSIWNKQQKIGPFDIFHFTYNLNNSQKQEVRRSEQFDRFESNHSIRGEIEKLNQKLLDKFQFDETWSTAAKFTEAIEAEAEVEEPADSSVDGTANSSCNSHDFQDDALIADPSTEAIYAPIAAEETEDKIPAERPTPIRHEVASSDHSQGELIASDDVHMQNDDDGDDDSDIDDEVRITGCPSDGTMPIEDFRAQIQDDALIADSTYAQDDALIADSTYAQDDDLIADPSTEAIDAPIAAESYSNFSLDYRNLSDSKAKIKKQMKILLSQKFILEFDKQDGCKDWRQKFINIRSIILQDIVTIMRVSFMYLKGISKNILASSSFENFRVNRCMIEEVNEILNPEEKREYYQIVNTHTKAVNKFFLHCVTTVCVNVGDIHLTEKSRLDAEIESYLTSNKNFMDVLSSSERSNIILLGETYGIINTRSIRSTRNDIRYEDTSTSSKRRIKRKLEDKEVKSIYTKSIRSQSRVKKSKQNDDFGYTSNDSSIVNQIAFSGRTSSSKSKKLMTNEEEIDVTKTDDDVDLNLTDDPIHKWFTMLQKINAEASGTRLHLQWVEVSGCHSPAYEIARLHLLRKDFLTLINDPGCDDSAIKTFILSRGFFQIQVQFDKDLYNCTKADGLSLWRSLIQQKSGETIDFARRHQETDDWNGLDVKLEFEESRTDFITFLTSLMEALTFISIDNISQNIIDELKFVWMPKIQYTLDKIRDFNDD
jgi:hypothetical protein